MADPLRSSHDESDLDLEGRDEQHPIPHWVKAFGAVGVVLVVVFVVTHLAGGGFQHHTPYQGADDRAAPETRQ